MSRLHDSNEECYRKAVLVPRIVTLIAMMTTLHGNYFSWPFKIFDKIYVEIGIIH
jgi:hypothetical protein